MTTNDILNAFDELMITAEAHYKVDLSNLELDLTNLKGLAAGMARYTEETGELVLQINPQVITDYPHKEMEVLIHEMAHIVEFALFGSSDHGANWKRIHKWLGGEEGRCHDMKLTPARKTRRWLYQVGGASMEIATVTHNRMQNKGMRRICTENGMEFGAEHFVKEIV